MRPKKDNLSDDLNIQGQESRNEVTNEENVLKNKQIESSSIFKRTQKLVTALYMVTECLNDEEPLKNKLRTNALNFLSKTASINAVNALRTHLYFEDIENTIKEILSLLELATMVGLIGTMNGNILMKEFTLLSASITQLKKENMNGKFTLERFRSQPIEGLVFPEEILKSSTASTDRDIDRHLNGEIVKERPYSQGHQDLLKKYLDTYKGQNDDIITDNRLKNRDHFYKGQKNKDIGHSKKMELALKNERRNTILKLFKDKQEIMIKDITPIIKDCSEKTLQRELFSLVSEGILKKKGEKRWSRYYLA